MTERMSAKQYRDNAGPAKKPSKYGNKRTIVDGIAFDSKAEARRYQSLKAMQASGRISRLELQPRYPLRAKNGDTICTYVGDFEYLELGADGQPLCIVCEDVKGFLTQVYKLKIKWAKSDYPGVDFREVR